MAERVVSMATKSRRTKIAAEEKTRIVLSVLAGEMTCAEAARRIGVSSAVVTKLFRATPTRVSGRRTTACSATSHAEPRQNSLAGKGINEARGRIPHSRRHDNPEGANNGDHGYHRAKCGQ
jgi:transposase-like protein